MAQSDNVDIMNAIVGTDAMPQQSTMSTGLGSTPSSIPGQTSALDTNPNYQRTMQGLMGNQNIFNPYMTQGPGSQSMHSIGRDSWSSNMSLDPQTIMTNLGIGGHS